MMNLAALWKAPYQVKRMVVYAKNNLTVYKLPCGVHHIGFVYLICPLFQY